MGKVNGVVGYWISCMGTLFEDGLPLCLWDLYWLIGPTSYRQYVFFQWVVSGGSVLGEHRRRVTPSRFKRSHGSEATR